MKFLVIGDGMNDRYWCGSATRLSPEQPIAIVAIENVYNLPGGSWNVSENLWSLQAQVWEPSPANIIPRAKDSCPIKNRLIANGVQIARWDEHDWCLPIEIEEIKKQKVDRIIIADYDKGTVTPEVILALYEMNLPTFVDTKCDPSPYLGWTTTIFPNVKEYSEFKPTYDLFERCVVTMGEHGASLLEFGKEIEHVEAFARNVVCVSGAGDTFSVCYSVRWPRADALEFASLGAAVVVGKPFTATVNMKEINDLRKQIKKARKITL